MLSSATVLAVMPCEVDEVGSIVGPCTGAIPPDIPPGRPLLVIDPTGIMWLWSGPASAVIGHVCALAVQGMPEMIYIVGVVGDLLEAFGHGKGKSRV